MVGCADPVYDPEPGAEVLHGLGGEDLGAITGEDDWNAKSGCVASENIDDFLTWTTSCYSDLRLSNMCAEILRRNLRILIETGSWARQVLLVVRPGY